MKVTSEFLERKVQKINNWLQSTPTTHHSYSQEKRKRNYYVSKLCKMDNENLETIKI